MARTIGSLKRERAEPETEPATKRKRADEAAHPEPDPAPETSLNLDPETRRRYRAALYLWPETLGDFLNNLLRDSGPIPCATRESADLIAAIAECSTTTRFTVIPNTSTGELGVWIDNLRDPFGRTILHACAHYDTCAARRLRRVLVEKCAADPDVTYAGIRPSELQKVTEEAQAALDRGLEEEGLQFEM